MSKTTCFGVVKIVLNLQRNGTFSTKTNCFGVMMVYDAFAKRVISPNKQIINKLASIMMLLQKSTLRNNGSTCEIKIVNGW